VIVEAERLVVKFRRGWRRAPFLALNGLDLEVREGDVFALLGQNGAGKSTAMHCLIGLLRPSSGSVRIMGERPEPGAPVFNRIAYLPEEPQYHAYLTVEEAVTYYARLQGVAAPEAGVTRMLERLGLAEHRRLSIARCSKGMKQKVGIAQCLLHQPRLLFLDEPMRGLDPMTVHLFRELILELRRDGATVLLNSHLLSEVELLANRVAIIDRGRLVAQDDVARLARRDGDVYDVEIDDGAGVEVPAQLESVTRADGQIRGTLPMAALYGFMDHARSRGLRTLFAVSSHLRNRTAKLIFTRPGRPEIWLLSVFLSAFVVAAAIHLVAAAVTGVLCLVWGVPYQIGFLFQTLDGLLETVLLMSVLASLGTMMHPVIAVLLVVALQDSVLRSLQFAVAIGIETTGRPWYYSTIDWLVRGLSWFVPTLNPFERETRDVYEAMRASAAHWGWLGLSAVYTAVTCACCFLIASWSLRRRPLI
jgi:ABC-type multidrug transport system ATPase subunit